MTTARVRYSPVCECQGVGALRVPAPVPSRIGIRIDRHTRQDVCPWNARYSQEQSEPAFEPRTALGQKDARTLARELLVMTQDEFSPAFAKSPMKRAKPRGLKRNVALVLGNVGMAEDVDALERALEDDEPIVPEHATWALDRLRGYDVTAR